MNTKHDGGIKISLPTKSKYRCRLLGKDDQGIFYQPPEGHEPNWFWRLTQYLAFGFKWEKVKDVNPKDKSTVH